MASPTKAELLARADELGVTGVDENTTNADLSSRIAEAEAGQDAPAADQAQQDAEADGIVPDAGELEQALGQDTGYIGEKVDPRPNEAYSQESDPTTSPSALEGLEAGRNFVAGAPATTEPAEDAPAD